MLDQGRVHRSPGARCSTFRVTQGVAHAAIGSFRRLSRTRYENIFFRRNGRAGAASFVCIKRLTALRQSNSNSLFAFEHRRGAKNSRAKSWRARGEHESRIRDRMMKQRKKQRLLRAR